MKKTLTPEDLSKVFRVVVHTAPDPYNREIRDEQHLLGVLVAVTVRTGEPDGSELQSIVLQVGSENIKLTATELVTVTEVAVTETVSSGPPPKKPVKKAAARAPHRVRAPNLTPTQEET